MHYNYNDHSEKNMLLGTFHEWNDTYYINISENLYDTKLLRETVIHETRHMIVEYLKDEKIIDLTKYTEEIASKKNIYYCSMLSNGIYLLKNLQTNGENI